MSNRPIKQFNSGVSYGVQIAVWEGDKRNSFSITKRYKTSEGDYKNTSYLGLQDLGALLSLIQRAIAWEEERHEQSRNQPSDEVPQW